MPGMTKIPVARQGGLARVPHAIRLSGTKIGTTPGAAAGRALRMLLVPIEHEEEPMNRTLSQLDREWADLDRSPTTAGVLERWGAKEPALAGLGSLGAVLRERQSGRAPEVLSALARLAADDELAARTLLHALVPGLLALASTSCADDPLAFDEFVSLAWERIRTYPTARPGSVAANVIWDVRKRYREHRAIEDPDSPGLDPESIHVGPSAEEIVLARSTLDHVVAAERDGVIGSSALRLILRTRVDEVPLGVAAAEEGATPQRANCIRWRAERRLRPVLAAS